MNYKRGWLLLIISILFSLLVSGLVSAGCCISSEVGQGCSFASSVEECETQPYYNFLLDDCNDLPECDLVCCCDLSSDCNVQINNSCNYPSTADCLYTGSDAIGEACSCLPTGTFAVSGTILRKTGGTVSGATVTSGSVTTTAGSDGTYVLNDVPGGGDVLVRAFKEDCLPGSTTISSLNSDQSNIDIQLNCVCAPESCDAENNAYCNENEKWDIYDLSVPLEEETYCGFCAADDPSDCGVSSSCVNGDSSCPVICSSDPGSSNYDSDCECNSVTPNGVCPVECTMYNDADCNIYTASCGDNIVSYPYETCEDNPFEGQNSLCDPDDCADPGETGECNCLSLSGCGNLILDPGETCEIGMICPDGTPCENCECGPLQCIGEVKNPTLILEFDADNKEMDLSWSLLESCEPSVATYTIFKCLKDTGIACSSKTEGFFSLDTVPKSLMAYSDTGITESKEYCYYVQANYLDLSEAESSIVCKQSGNYYCMEPHPPEFCMNNIRSECDENNNIVSIENCNPGKFCMGPDSDGKTFCSEQGVCDTCNRLYGLFANLDLTVRVEEGAYFVDKYCHYSPGRDVVQGCLFDRTTTLFSGFDYCANIVSCYDYMSQAACKDPMNPCEKNQGCEWMWLDQANNELGGVCRPVTAELQKCELCDSEKYNWLSPGCTYDVCKLFGECYFRGSSTTKVSAETCTKQSTASCFDYVSNQECTGGIPVSVDAEYDEDIRISGTHQVMPSSDTLDLKKCYWDSVNNRCLRNADNYPENNQGFEGFDCRIGDFYCESDFSNPETTILPSGFGVYPADMNILFNAFDNYPSDQLKTYFCVSTSTCYPSDLADNVNGEYSATLDSSGTYNLYYYSEDPAKNLEIVKSTQIKVDAEPPFIDLTSPANPEEFPTNQQVVSAVGKTSVDSKYVCSKIVNAGTTINCINNCALTSNKQPCFSDTTGVFNMDIEIGNNDMTEVIFFAEDFAGNKYSNTLLGILLDLEPPSEPDILISEY